MIVANKKVVTFHYTLGNDQGEQLESTRERDRPMTYLHGAGSIIPGLEKSMTGKAPGESFEITLAPAEAYGERRPGNVRRIPSKHFKDARALRPGQMVSVQTRQGNFQAVVVKVGRFNIDVDANHPLAGQTLTFNVEIVDVRDASPEEIAHGHVHGPGGVQH